MRLIEKASNRTLTGYSEKHHVVPRCMGGSDDTSNLVSLTPEEHYTAHLLLMKIFPENGALVRGALMMCADSPTTPRQNKAYGWVKRRYAHHNSVRMKEWHQQNEHPFKNKHHTENAKRRIGQKAKQRQQKNVFCFSVETGQLIAQYLGMQDAADAVGLHPQTIYSCVRVPGKRTAGGFSWSYSEQSPGAVAMHRSGKRKIIVQREDSKTRQKAWLNPKAHKETWMQAGEIHRIVIDEPKMLAAFARASSSPNTVYRIAQRLKRGWSPATDIEFQAWKQKQ